MAIKELGAAVLTPASGQIPKAGASNPLKAEFSTYLKDALGEVNQLQQSADKAIQQLVGEGKGDLQDTMVALEKADISFRFMMQVRNKVLEAYQEIMRMQV
jgi:flagellar hook-basal body complex protein FliE